MRSPQGKRRTRQHVIADLAINFVERQALLCGYTIERIHYDYGIDLELKTYNEAGEREPGDVLLQVKATDRSPVLAGRPRPTRPSPATHYRIPVRIERAHLRSWLSELEPVILIVFDATRTRAYWVCIQDYFSALPKFDIDAVGETTTVRIPASNRVTPAAMRKLAALRDVFRAQSRNRT